MPRVRAASQSSSTTKMRDPATHDARSPTMTAPVLARTFNNLPSMETGQLLRLNREHQIKRVRADAEADIDDGVNPSNSEKPNFSDDFSALIPVMGLGLA